MIIDIKIDSKLTSLPPNWKIWSDLSKEILFELLPHGVIPQSCNIKTTLTPEELKCFENELD